jgi:hypothetical protein
LKGLYHYDDGDQPSIEIYDPDLWVAITVFAKMGSDRLDAISRALRAIAELLKDKPTQLVARFDQERVYLN